MKKIVFTGLALFLANYIFGQDMSMLPQSSQDFITSNFTSDVEKAEEEDGIMSMDSSEKYEVHLMNGIKLDFDGEGNVTEIDSRDNTPIPTSVIPGEISAYIESNHAGVAVVIWEKDNDEQEVELADGTELEFDLNGKLLKED